MDEFFEAKKPKKTDDEEYIVEEKKVTLFDYLHDICQGKKGDLQKKDPDMKQFSSYMVLKYLSLEEEYLPFIDIMNRYQGCNTKEQMYKVLLILIPRCKKFLSYPKLKEKICAEKDVALVARYFKCAKSEAFDFMKMGFIKKKDIEIIKEKYGGMGK